MLPDTDAGAVRVTVFAKALSRIRLPDISVDVGTDTAEVTAILEALSSIEMMRAGIDVGIDAAEVTVITEALFRIELIISAEAKCIRVISKLSWFIASSIWESSA